MEFCYPISVRMYRTYSEDMQHEQLLVPKGTQVTSNPLISLLRVLLMFCSFFQQRRFVMVNRALSVAFLSLPNGTKFANSH